MDYNKIVAVTGLPGLYELINSKTDGAIVRSLDDKSTRFVSNRIHNFSHLESIEVFTKRENANLADVLKAIEASQEKLPDEKDTKALKTYFEKVYPDLDFDRVYSSDLKKMIRWFIVLKKNSIDIKLPEAPAEEVKPEKIETDPAPAQEEPAPKPKKAAKKTKDADGSEPEKKPEAKPKKAAAKKKSEK